MPIAGLLLAGVSIRVLVVGALLLSGATIPALLRLSDGAAYAAVARMFVTGVRPDTLPDGVFPGWPALVALPGWIVGYDAAALWGGVLCAAVVPVLVDRLTGDRPLAWLLAVAPPTWLMHSMLGMSEPAALALVLGALLGFQAGRSTLASTLVTAALLMRPHALAAWLALAFAFWRDRDLGGLARHGAVAALVGGLTLVWNQAYYGDALYQLHTYETLTNYSNAEAVLAAHGVGPGHWGAPFRHLVMTPIWIPVPPWKVVFIWAHVAAVLGASAIGVARWGRSRLHDLFTVWAVMNTAFIVCAGPYWGFHSFDRYTVWALPAYAFLLRQVVPGRPRLLAAAGAVSTVLAWVGLQRHPL